MPKTTAGGGPSNAAAAPGETGYHDEDGTRGHPGAGEEMTEDGATGKGAGEPQGKQAAPKAPAPAPGTPPRGSSAATGRTEPPAGG